MFMFEGDFVVVNIEDSMRKPRDFYKLSVLAIFIVVFFDLIMAVIPYLTYLDNADHIILESMTNSNIRNYLRAVYPIAVLSSTPILVYPLSEIIYRSKFLEYFSLFQHKPKYKFYVGAISILIF
mmetsp:Transcript_2798/g.3263  ORF Transcript_2798/g.3263 Transcript_2798/m.3263 type:complete len:124 (+) Transcript_2798:863-1234(+)